MLKNELEINVTTKQKVQTFLERLMSEVKLNDSKYYYPAMFDFDSVTILTVIVSSALKNRADDPEKGLSVKIANETLSRHCGGKPDRFGVRTKLTHLARYFLISVDTSGRKIETNSGIYINDTQTIKINPALEIAIFSPNSKRKFVKDFIKKCVHLGATRDKTEQGLTANYYYGAAEISHNVLSLIDFGDKFAQKTQETAEEISKKTAENKLWRAYNIDFIHQAAKCWTVGMQRMGNGSAIPVWADLANTGSDVSKMRRNLTKMFESMGGAVTSLAWYIYTHGMPSYKEDGSLAFNLKEPHRQFKGSDMKPNGFAKHFNAILTDKDFRYFSTVGWHKGGREILLEYFTKETLEIGPRDGTPYPVKLGYLFGDKPINNPPTKRLGEEFNGK